MKKMLDGYANNEEMMEEEKDEIGGIFHKVSEKQRRKMTEKDELDEYDSSLFIPSYVRDWTSDEVCVIGKLYLNLRRRERDKTIKKIASISGESVDKRLLRDGKVEKIRRC